MLELFCQKAWRKNFKKTEAVSVFNVIPPAEWFSCFLVQSVIFTAIDIIQSSSASHRLNH